MTQGRARSAHPAPTGLPAPIPESPEAAESSGMAGTDEAEAQPRGLGGIQRVSPDTYRPRSWLYLLLTSCVALSKSFNFSEPQSKRL